MGLPCLSELIVKIPIYQKLDLAEELTKSVFELRTSNGRFDAYCPFCRKEATFHHLINSLVSNGSGTILNIITGDFKTRDLNGFHFNEVYICSRDIEHHKIIVTYYVDAGSLIKVGQYPSIADLESGEIIKYRKALDKAYYQEFSKAIGLKSHGIGVGSFVYLRRIFEKLLEEAHEKLLGTTGWDEEAYKKAKVDEKINLLHKELPSFLVETRTLYGILSKGIHELSEEECLEYFEPVKLGIELILDEVISKKEQQNKIAQAKKTLGTIVQKIKES